MAELVGRRKPGKVDVPVTLRPYRLAPVEARMEDVSSAGALIATDDPEVMRGDEVLLDLGWAEVVVTVAWATEGYRGVSFHRALRDSDVETIRRRSRIRH